MDIDFFISHDILGMESFCAFMISHIHNLISYDIDFSFHPSQPEPAVRETLSASTEFVSLSGLSYSLSPSS